QSQERLPDLVAGGARGGGPCDHDVVPAGHAGAVVAHAVAQDALDPVAADRAWIDLARHGQAQPRFAVAGQPVQAEQGIAKAAPPVEHAGIFHARTDPGAARESRARVRGHLAGYRGGPASGRQGRDANQALRRLRPLARRRARTLRPSAVFMRARKPWSRLRLRLLGWKVRLVAMAALDS